MNTTILRVNIRDITPQFIKDLEEKAGASAQVEIKLDSKLHGEGLFSEEQFWKLIDLLDWQQKNRADIIAPVIEALSKMPISNIYLFEDWLSEKLFNIDTKRHADAYLLQQTDEFFSADNFLYVRCAIVAEGRDYYENILNSPAELSADVDFEHLLTVAALAYKRKTGREFEYSPIYNYETKSNIDKWS